MIMGFGATTVDHASERGDIMRKIMRANNSYDGYD